MVLLWGWLIGPRPHAGWCLVSIAIIRRQPWDLFYVLPWMEALAGERWLWVPGPVGVLRMRWHPGRGPEGQPEAGLWRRIPLVISQDGSIAQIC